MDDKKVAVLDKRIAAFTPDDIAEVNAQMESWHNAITNEHLCKAFQHLPGFDAELFMQAIEEDAMQDGVESALYDLLYRASGLKLAKSIEHGSYELDEVA